MLGIQQRTCTHIATALTAMDPECLYLCMYSYCDCAHSHGKKSVCIYVCTHIVIAHTAMVKRVFVSMYVLIL